MLVVEATAPLAGDPHYGAETATSACLGLTLFQKHTQLTKAVKQPNGHPNSPTATLLEHTLYWLQVFHSADAARRGLERGLPHQT